MGSRDKLDLSFCMLHFILGLVQIGPEDPNLKIKTCTLGFSWKLNSKHDLFSSLLGFEHSFCSGLEPCPCFPIFLARTTFVLVPLSESKIPGQDAIFGNFVLEFIFPFVRPSEYIIIPEVCAQGWSRGSTPVLFVEFRSFFLTYFFIFSSHLCTFLANLRFFLSNLRTFLLNLRTFLSIFVATEVYALPSKVFKILASRLFSSPCLSQILSSTPAFAAKMQFYFLHFLRGKDAQNRPKNQRN